MKTVFRITAILNLLLVVISFICVVIGAMNKEPDLFVCSVVLELVSIFPTTIMIVLLTDFTEADK